jgi:hypothetical protein
MEMIRNLDRIEESGYGIGQDVSWTEFAHAQGSLVDVTEVLEVLKKPEKNGTVIQIYGSMMVRFIGAPSLSDSCCVFSQKVIQELSVR